MGDERPFPNQSMAQPPMPRPGHRGPGNSGSRGRQETKGLPATWQEPGSLRGNVTIYLDSRISDGVLAGASMRGGEPPLPPLVFRAQDLELRVLAQRSRKAEATGPGVEASEKGRRRRPPPCCLGPCWHPAPQPVFPHLPWEALLHLGPWLGSGELVAYVRRGEGRWFCSYLPGAAA